MVNILLSSLCEGIEDNIQAQAGPEVAGYEQEGIQDPDMQVDPSMVQQDPNAQVDPDMMQDNAEAQTDPNAQMEDPTMQQVPPVTELTDSEKLRKLKGVSREDLNKSDIELLQKYGLID